MASRRRRILVGRSAPSGVGSSRPARVFSTRQYHFSSPASMIGPPVASKTMPPPAGSGTLSMVVCT